MIRTNNHTINSQTHNQQNRGMSINEKLSVCLSVTSLHNSVTLALIEIGPAQVTTVSLA